MQKICVGDTYQPGFEVWEAWDVKASAGRDYAVGLHLAECAAGEDAVGTVNTVHTCLHKQKESHHRHAGKPLLSYPRRYSASYWLFRILAYTRQDHDITTIRQLSRGVKADHVSLCTPTQFGTLHTNSSSFQTAIDSQNEALAYISEAVKCAHENADVINALFRPQTKTPCEAGRDFAVSHQSAHAHRCTWLMPQVA